MQLRSTPRSHPFPNPRKGFLPPRSVFRPAILAASIAALLASHSAQAASQVWDGGSLLNGNWAATSNWVGEPSAPGATSGTTNPDHAYFTGPSLLGWGTSAGNPVVIDPNRNIGGINFYSAAGSYFRAPLFTRIF